MAVGSSSRTWELYSSRRSHLHPQEQSRLHTQAGDVQTLLKAFFHPDGTPNWLDPPPELTNHELKSFLLLARRDLRRLPSAAPRKDSENVILLDDRSHDFEFAPSGRLENDKYRGRIGKHQAMSIQAFHDYAYPQMVL
jgi:hypothetical protein